MTTDEKKNISKVAGGLQDKEMQQMKHKKERKKTVLY